MAFSSFNELFARVLYLRAHLREMSWVVVAQSAGVIGALASVKAATTALGPGDYGRLAAALAVAGMVQVCLYGAISQGASRFLFFSTATRSLEDYLRALVMLLALAVGAVIAIWTVAYIAGIDGKFLGANWLLALFVVASGSQMVLLGILNAARARRSVAALQVLEAIGRPALIFASTGWLMTSPDAVLVAYVISATVISGIALTIPFGLRSKLLTAGEMTGMASDKSLFHQMLLYILPFVIFGVAGALGSHGERLLLAAWVSWEEVGVYALMSQIAVTPALLLTGLINQFYLPVIFHQDPGGTADFGPSFRRYLLVSAGGIAVLAFVVLIAGPYLIPLISTKAFLGHEHLLALLVVSAGFFGMGQQLVLPGLRALRSYIYIGPKIIHSAALLVGAMLLVPGYGLDGMAVASVSAAALYAMAITLANKYGGVRI